MKTSLPRSNRSFHTGSLILSILCSGATTRNALAADPQQAPLESLSGTKHRQAPTHDVIDEETLRSRAKQANHEVASSAAKTMPLAAKHPSTQSSLLTSSIFISDGEKFTIVPIGSVLHLPADLRSLIIARPNGDILMWPDFLQKNGSWITVKEVPLAMSRGETKPTAAMLREILSETRILIAVYRGCPITILEPAKSDERPKLEATDRP
jgi:hypothetical protein